MTPVLVDSNVLLDQLTEDPRWVAWSDNMIARVAETAPLVINPIIYAEVSIRFRSIEEVEEAFPPSYFRRDPLPFEAAFLAGKAYMAYRRRGGRRRSPLPDFFIGAHAAVAGYRLLTRDARRYKSYFPTVPLIAP
ncbi:MAG: type II toxin-antitoxin system VapC family toxin [Deltaproteobacteria bacterium]|nr:type II toxin-antitoxin system VapC family toxin [Deltaproteobacteria bacterium]